MHRAIQLLLVLLLVFPLVTRAEIDPDELLTAKEAFVLNPPTVSQGLIRLTWKAAENYYLYDNQFQISSSNEDLSLGKLITPSGEMKLDDLFGEVEVHRGEVEVLVPYQYSGSALEVEIQTRSQGCADGGVCYPPQKQNLTVSLPDTMAAVPAALDLTNDSAPKKSSLASKIGGFGDEPELLTAAEAFKLSPEIDGDSLIVRFQVADQYYLYRDKIKMSFEHPDVSVDAASFPPGEWVDDPEFGMVEVYRNEVTGVYPIIGPAGEYQLSLLAEHQGCADAGLCYPPVKETFSLPATLSGTQTVASVASAANPGPSASNNSSNKEDWFFDTLQNGKLWQVSLATLAFGLLLAFTACMYPMIPILSGIIIGQNDSAQAKGESIKASKSLTLSVVYVLAVALTFGVIGGLTATLGSGVGIQAYFQSPWLLIPFSILFIMLALSLFGLYDIQVPNAIQSRLQEYSNKQEGGNYAGVAIMGVFSALIIGPCGGPILIAALGYAAASSNLVSGFVALFFLGLGMGLPLLVIGAGGSKLLPKAGGWMVGVKAFGGVILLAVAILMLERMPGIFPPKLVMALWSALIVISGYFLMGIGRGSDAAGQSGGKHLLRGIGLMAIIYGMLVMLGGLTGGTRVTDPFTGSALTTASNANNSQTQAEFIYVKSIDDLKNEIASANAAGKTVMLDFYADWCTYCKKYDAYVFPDPRVQNALANTVLLKADVTATDAIDKALMQSLEVILPPAILFFGNDGDEIRSARVVGELNADQFYEHVSQAL